jgi:hypothetical protein
MADFLQKFDHFHQAVNYFTTIEEAEWFWPQKVGTSFFECIHKACRRTRRFSESHFLGPMRQQKC